MQKPDQVSSVQIFVSVSDTFAFVLPGLILPCHGYNIKAAQGDKIHPPECSPFFVPVAPNTPLHTLEIVNIDIVKVKFGHIWLNILKNYQFI